MMSRLILNPHFRSRPIRICGTIQGMSGVRFLGPHIAVAVGLASVGAAAIVTKDASMLEGVRNTFTALFDPFIAIPALVLGVVVRNPVALAPVLFTLGFMIGGIYSNFYANFPWPAPALQYVVGHVAGAFIAGYLSNAIITFLKDGYE